MPKTHGAVKHGQESRCNSTDVVRGPADKGCTASRHGTAAAYRRGCRCDIARQDIVRYEKRRLLERLHGHTRMLPNTGALRRLQALRALGWPSRELARRIGVDERNISRWPHRSLISRAHFNAVCRVYEDLSAKRGPDERARRYAARQGWLPPLAWDDDTIDDPGFDPELLREFMPDTLMSTQAVDSVVIDRACDLGQPVPSLNRAEKACAYREMDRRRVPRNEIARRLRISGTTARELAETPSSPPEVVNGRHHSEHMNEAAS